MSEMDEQFVSVQQDIASVLLKHTFFINNQM